MKISVKKMALAMALTAMPMMGFAGNKGPEWLSKAVAYQIYPSSYQDSDGDGIGDIPGITSRLDYIKGLGVNVIWLNPVFVSGWFDGGYDIIDFYKVDPRFGNNTDLVKLIPGHMQRGGSPSAYDRVLATQFGSYAAQLVEVERYGVTVAMVNRRVTENRLADIAGKTRNVPENCELLSVARRMGVCLG